MLLLLSLASLHLAIENVVAVAVKSSLLPHIIRLLQLLLLLMLNQASCLILLLQMLLLLTLNLAGNLLVWDLMAPPPLGVENVKVRGNYGEI